MLDSPLTGYALLLLMLAVLVLSVVKAFILVKRSHQLSTMVTDMDRLCDRLDVLVRVIDSRPCAWTEHVRESYIKGQS